jgi:hypothetical protein
MIEETREERLKRKYALLQSATTIYVVYRDRRLAIERAFELEQEIEGILTEERNGRL